MIAPVYNPWLKRPREGPDVLRHCILLLKLTEGHNHRLWEHTLRAVVIHRELLGRKTRERSVESSVQFTSRFPACDA